MPQGNPRSGERYLHFKNKLYQIITIAEHSETAEKLVIYQALYGNFAIYARPLSMFISEVDHEKYPQTEQKYRFMLVEEKQKVEEQKSDDVETTTPESAETEKQKLETTTLESAETEKQKLETTTPESAETEKQRLETTTLESAETEKNEVEEVTDLLMKFYDARTYEEKYKILTCMRNDITDGMINNMAIVLDVVIAEGDLEKRYEELKRCLRTYEKYEIFR